MTNDVDKNIALSSTDPPTFNDRVLEWSGGERIPAMGEMVTVAVTELVYHGVVTSYFQAHGWLGVVIDDELAVFGSEVIVDDVPQKVMVN